MVIGPRGGWTPRSRRRAPPTSVTTTQIRPATTDDHPDDRPADTDVPVRHTPSRRMVERGVRHVEHETTGPLDLARAAVATPVVSWRTGLPASRVLAGLVGGDPIPEPAGCRTGGIIELAAAASDPAHVDGDETARAETAAALLRTFGLQAHLDRVRLRQVLQVHRGTRQLDVSVSGGGARLNDGDQTTSHPFDVEQPWQPWDVAHRVGELLDHPVDVPRPVPAAPEELPQIANDLATVLGTRASFHTPEAAAMVTALGDAVIRIARAARPSR